MMWGGVNCGTSSPTVTYNHISDCGHEGVDTQPPGGSPYIAHNIIEDSAGGMVIATGASPIVEYNTFIDNDRGIWIDQGDGIIRYNSISSPNGAPNDWTYGDFSYEAWALHGRYHEIRGIGIVDASPTIFKNTLSNNSIHINISGNSSPIITYNSIINGNVGLYGDIGVYIHYLIEGDPKMNMNNIFGNRHGVFLYSDVVGVFDATNNWWGTTDPNVINSLIYDYHDDPHLGEVDYEPFLTEQVDISTTKR